MNDSHAKMDSLSSVKRDVVAWIDSVADTPGETTGRWKYNRHMLRQWGVESSALAVMTLDGIGELDRVEPAKRAVLADALLDFQDPQTGHFIDPLICEADRARPDHTWEHIWHHHTGVCVEALALLGDKPRYPLPMAAFEPLRPGESARQVNDLNWANPWLVGEHFFRMVACYRRTHPELQPGQVDDVLEAAFAVIERNVINPASGLPDTRGCRSQRVAAAGLFKTLFAYRECGRAFPLAERAIDTVLSIQAADGGFGADDMCIHWDCAWVLRTLNRQLARSHRARNISAAGGRLADFFMREHRKPDGAFSFFRKHCLAVHNSIRVSDPLAESDMLGTYMVCDSLRGLE